MLETSRERIKLLKAGISARKIEQLYLKTNNFKIVNFPVLFEAVEIIQENEGKGFICEVPVEYVNA
jgi:hypothetical protein